MSRTTHLVLQGLVQAGQLFVSSPGVTLSPNWTAGLHAVLAGLTLVIAGYSHRFNTDGSPQEKPFHEKPQGAE
jgi:hypothetical protein